MFRLLVFMALSCSAMHAMQYNESATKELRNRLDLYITGKIALIPEAAIGHLVTGGADPNVEGKKTRVSEATIKRLVIEGADPDVEVANHTWCSAIALFGIYYRQDLLSFLLNHGANPNLPKNFRVFQDAIGYNIFDLAAQFIKFGVNVIHTDDFGNTPLHYAVDGYRPAITQLLLENGAGTNIESPNVFGQTPLYLATSNTHQGVVPLLESYNKQKVA